MLACEGSVTTAWACVRAKTRPSAASRSSVGVLTFPEPEKPVASWRRVSIVTSNRSRRSAVGDVLLRGEDPGSPHPGVTAPSARSSRTIPNASFLLHSNGITRPLYHRNQAPDTPGASVGSRLRAARRN